LFGDERQIAKEGLNHEVQGTVADIMKRVMYQLSQIGMSMVLQRHDGFYHSVPLDWDDWVSYKGIIEQEWIIDGRPISFPAEYDEISA
jgi:DNA polymerase I-like protein with 3'-5' exonuclease and polymerase domains